MIDDRHRIASAAIAVEVLSAGAELASVRGADGTELLWQAGPEWPRHAPVLFPIVGRIAGDTLRHGGKAYPLTQHGFARDARFDLVERSETALTLRLTDDASTHARFPFAFRLDQTYEVDGATLTVTSTVHNPGDAVLPCGVGAHPAFRWPLDEACPKDRHVLVFETAETGPVLSVEGGLLGAPKPAVPFDGDRLALRDDLFAKDALVLPDVRSRHVRFAAIAADGTEKRAITVAWDGYKDLGIWSKPAGAPFLCIEPWFSMASPVGWDGEFADKPGILHVSAGESRSFSWSVTL